MVLTDGQARAVRGTLGAAAVLAESCLATPGRPERYEIARALATVDLLDDTAVRDCCWDVECRATLTRLLNSDDSVQVWAPPLHARLASGGEAVDLLGFAHARVGADMQESAHLAIALGVGGYVGFQPNPAPL